MAPRSGTPSLSDLVRAIILDATRYLGALGRLAGLGTTDLIALSHLERGPLASRELGDRLGISSASMTILADRLTRDGRLRRVPHPHDRRRVILVATSKGLREVRLMLSMVDQDVAAASKGLSPRDRTTVMRFLASLHAQRTHTNPRC